MGFFSLKPAKPLFLAGLCAYCVVIFAPQAAFAAQQPQALPTIVVSATAEESDARTLPANVQVIEASQIPTASSLADILEEFVPGTLIMQPGGYNRMGLRGFLNGRTAGSSMGDPILLLIDGHKSGAANPAYIPAALIERVEIVRGPASVLYGGSAMGGVINVITKKGTGPMQGSLSAEVTLPSAYSAQNFTAGFSGGLPQEKDTKAKSKYGFAFGMLYKNQSEYKAGHGWLFENSQGQNAAFGASATWRPAENQSLSLVGLHQNVFGTGNPGDRVWPYPSAKASARYSSLSLDYAGTTEKAWGIDAALFFNTSSYLDDHRKSAFPYTSSYKTQSLGGRLQLGIPLGALQENSAEARTMGIAGRLAIGGEVMRQSEKAGGTSISQPDADYTIASLFAEYRYKTPDASFSLVAGGRYDHYQTSLRQNAALGQPKANRDFGQVTWNAGATWYPAFLADFADIGVFARVGTAFVPPTALYLAGDYFTWGANYKGNANLQAEKSLTAEAGVKLEKGPLTLGATAFFTWYNGRIVAEETIPWTLYEYKNQGKERLFGFDLSASLQKDFWIGEYLLETRLYSEAEIFTERKTYPKAGQTSTVLFVPAYSATAGLDLKHGPWLLQGGVRFVGPQFATYMGNTKHREAFDIWHARLTYSFTDAFSVYVDGQNLTDSYYAYTLDFPMPGRAISLGFTWKF